jgi:hypothetical protein
MDNKHIITIDRFFSIWIFLYTILYFLGIFPYNPVILISIALTFFIFSLFIIIPRLNQRSLLIYYITINTIGKIIPLFIIMNRKITIYDIIFTVSFILMYVVYMFIVKEDIFYVYTDYIEFIIDRDRAREGAIYHEISKIFTDLLWTL